MRGKYFLDTNVLVYSFDQNSPHKRDKARTLVADALAGNGMISAQVAQEFLNVALRKFARPMDELQASEFLERVLLPLCHVFPDPALYREALAVRTRWRLSWYDALVVAGAQRGGCHTLFTEDLQHGLVVGDLVVVDPFR